MVDPGTILTFMSIIKVGMDIIDRIRGSAKKAPKELSPASVSMFREKVASDVGQIAAERLRSDGEIRQGLSLMAQALSDWQISSTPLCPLVLRKTFAFGTEEKNIGLLPGSDDEAFIEETYLQWKFWIDQGPRNNTGLLVFVLESPSRDTIEHIREFNGRKHSWYHLPQYGCLDVHSGIFYGPPRGAMDRYLLSFGGDSFWNMIMKGLGCIVG